MLGMGLAGALRVRVIAWLGAKHIAEESAEAEDLESVAILFLHLMGVSP